MNEMLKQNCYVNDATNNFVQERGGFYLNFKNSRIGNKFKIFFFQSLNEKIDQNIECYQSFAILK